MRIHRLFRKISNAKISFIPLFIFKLQWYYCKLTFNQSITLSPYLSITSFLRAYFYLYVQIYFYLSICLLRDLFIYMHVYLHIYLGTYLSIYLSIYLCNYLFTIYLCIYLSIKHLIWVFFSKNRFGHIKLHKMIKKDL